MTALQTDRTLIHGGILLTLDPAVGDFPKGDVLVEGDRIIAIGAVLDVEDAATIEAAGMIVMPGLIDAHRHAWQGTLRRLMANVETLDAYVDATHFSLAKYYRPRDMYIDNRLTALGCLDAGITTIIDIAQCAQSRAFGYVDRCARTRRPTRALHARTPTCGQLDRALAERPGAASSGSLCVLRPVGDA